jgi:hypothetical protein
MGLLDIFSSGGIKDAAFNMLKSHLEKNNISSVALSVNKNPADDSDEEKFKVIFSQNPAVLVPVSELEIYKRAVLKCIEHGIEL